VGTGTMDGSDVGFLVDFSCHRAVDLPFLRRLRSAHDPWRRPLHVHGATSPRQRRITRLRREFEELREQVKKQAAVR
jgi:hypothetical protein